MPRRLLASLALTWVACGASPVESPGRAPDRLAAMPAPPVAWSTPIATLRDEDFERICPYLDAHVGLTRAPAHCPDGTTVEAYVYDCAPERSGPAARALPCTVTFGEMLACYLAIREHPCDQTPLGADLPECGVLSHCGIEVGLEGAP